MLRSYLYTLVGWTLVACLAVQVAGQGPASSSSAPSSSPSAAAPSTTQTTSGADTPTSATPVLSTFTSTTILPSGQVLPTSLRASASQSGSVYFIPVVTTIPPSSVMTPLPTPTENPATSTATNTTDFNRLPLQTKLDPAFGVLGAILIITGLPMTFYGHRNRWSSYFIAGYYCLALITISIILRVGVENAINPPSQGVRGLFLLATIVAGAVGGILSIVFWKGAALLASGLGGFAFGLFLQALRPGGLIVSIALRYILYIGLFGVFFALACADRIHRLVLAVATALAGATAVTLAVDCYSTQGLKEFYIRNLGFDALFEGKYPPTFQNGRFPLVQGMQIELGVLGALVIMGVAFQLRLWSDVRRNMALLRKSDEENNMRSKAERAARSIARTAKRDLLEWEKRHGYKKTAGRKTHADEERDISSSPDALKRQTTSVKSFSGKTVDELPYANRSASIDTRQLESPAGSSVLVAFPSVPMTRRNSSFLSYIQHGPEKILPDDGPPKLELEGITARPPPKQTHADVDVGTATPSGSLVDERRKILDQISNIRRSIVMLDSAASSSIGHGLSDTSPVVAPPAARTRSGPSLTQSEADMQSFRRRSVATTALMEGSGSFLGDVKNRRMSTPMLPQSSWAGTSEPENAGDSKQEGARSTKLSLPLSLEGAQLDSNTQEQQAALTDLTRDRIKSNSSARPNTWAFEHEPMQHLAPEPEIALYSVSPAVGGSASGHSDSLSAHAPMRAHSPAALTTREHQTSSLSRGRVDSSTFNDPIPVDTGKRASVSRMSGYSPLAALQGPEGHQRAQSGSLLEGQSAAVMAARRSIANRRDDTPSNPWTGVGFERTQRKSKARSMTIEELDARHRAKLAAMQKPVTQSVQEAEAVRKAREEWERKQKVEKRRMQERERERLAALAASGATSTSQDKANHSTESKRRTRRLSEQLLEAVGEEGRSGMERAAQWRNSIAVTSQLDPERPASVGSMPSSSGHVTAPATTAARSVKAAIQVEHNPFPRQHVQKRELSETDRRRLSQGALGSRNSRRLSQPLLEFDVPLPPPQGGARK